MQGGGAELRAHARRAAVAQVKEAHVRARRSGPMRNARSGRCPDGERSRWRMPASGCQRSTCRKLPCTEETPHTRTGVHGTPFIVLITCIVTREILASGGRLGRKSWRGKGLGRRDFSCGTVWRMEVVGELPAS